MPASEIIVFTTYESPWFPAGGIAAVMAELPGAVKAAAGLPTVVVTPYHAKSPKMAALQLEPVHDIAVRRDGKCVVLNVLCAQGKNCPWYLLKPVSGSFFSGERHPYDVPRDTLLDDALFFGAAAVQALPAIAQHLKIQPQNAGWNLFAQDWEGATALLAFASQEVWRGRLHLTLHNSYDEFAHYFDFNRVEINPDRSPGNTILDRSLHIVEQPAFTVSEQFAADFTQDLLQRQILAPHLQDTLSRFPVLGVNNGPFKALALDPTLLRQAETGDFEALQSWKAANRNKALDALALHEPSEKQPVWGNKDLFRHDASPWFVMAGRDDPRQKGYDVAAAAAGSYLEANHGTPGCAQFVFFPIQGDEGLTGLAFLQDLATRFPEDVLVFPFIWTAGFTAALQAAAFGLMPSLYEPFGMANEFYLSGGCVGIARATGGNLEQIVPLRASGAYSQAVRVRSAVHHSASAHPTGILFRESDDITTASADWAGINDARYSKTGGTPSRVEQRREFTVFRAMADELRIAIEDGIRISRDQPALYYRMLAEGVAHIQRTFSWHRAAQEYVRKVK